MSAQTLPELIRDCYLERVSLLMQHENVAQVTTDYDANNAYQYIIAREQTHLSWLQHALLDLGAPQPADPAPPAALSVKGDGWKSLASQDSRANTQFVEKWRPKLETITNARHKGMLGVIMGETLEHARLFEQCAAGRKDVIGKSLEINDHTGDVMPVRFVGDI